MLQIALWVVSNSPIGEGAHTFGLNVIPSIVPVFEFGSRQTHDALPERINVILKEVRAVPW